MQLIPVFKCRNMREAIRFYTGILDFELKESYASPDDVMVDLINGEIELQLTIMESGQLFGSVANVLVENVDDLFQKYIARGLDISGKIGSPVHRGPVDQSWGMREFYVSDILESFLYNSTGLTLLLSRRSIRQPDRFINRA